jgi:hypothetical protein
VRLGRRLVLSEAAARVEGEGRQHVVFVVLSLPGLRPCPGRVHFSRLLLNVVEIRDITQGRVRRWLMLFSLLLRMLCMKLVALFVTVPATKDLRW